ncbi:SAM-dependent methyltransferase [Eubacteriales bacterium OttesenSCG-928-G02]|nr:SAM-dependent methyltransferase [Eubacteriales bacterium OttesenSCG-928-G02]
MNDTLSLLDKIVTDDTLKLVFSKPKSKDNKYKKVSVVRTETFFHVEKFTEKQAFHENLKDKTALRRFCELELDNFNQINSWDANNEHILMISKKGKASYIKNKNNINIDIKSADKTKKYILKEGMIIPPLVDMGIFTAEGKIIKPMFKKYKQINRFIEIIDDCFKDKKIDTFNIIDFGCGKSYLTFILYYYFTEIKNINVRITGLDLKEEVIEKCNKTAEKYGYKNLNFKLGDISSFRNDEKTDMVVMLHACDTATDYGLFNAVCRDADYIFAVPCCQHEVNSQLKNETNLLFKHGIIKERFAALLTDSIRGGLLEYLGYKVQIMEFVEIENTAKNILIRCEKANRPVKDKEKSLKEVETILEQFDISQTLYNLIKNR